MDRDKLLYKLKEFYTLEVYQLGLYKSQLKALEEPHIRKAYELLVMREQEHVDFFAQKISEYNETPSVIIDSAFDAAGFITGKALDLLCLKDRYKLGMAVENKAVDMYEVFIQMASNDPELSDLANRLWYHLVDEEFHQYWFKEHLSRIIANET